MIDTLVNSGALPVLERLVQFTEARHRVLVHNIANLSTPYFKPADLSVRSFRQALAEAIDRRRTGGDPAAGPLELRNTRQLQFLPDRIQAAAEPVNENILFHDENNRDLERLMQRLAENTLAHRVGVELIRAEMMTLQTAIRERI